MNIVTLVKTFAENLLELQEKFSSENRFDLLEKEAVDLGSSTVAAFLSLTLEETDELSGVESFTAGDLTVRKSSTNAASRCLRYQADLMISPYSKDRFAFRGV